MSDSKEPTTGGVENRQHARAPIELQVEYKKMNTFFSDYTKNISKGGTFIKTARPLKVGTEFVFKLAIPALSKPFEIKGKVAWINTAEHKQNPEVEDDGMGIRFMYEDAKQRETFEGMVEDLMRESLGEVVFKKLLEKNR